MAEDYPEIMTVKEVAAYLKMKPVTIYKLSKEGKIPAFRVASFWRFKKDLIDKWLINESKKNTEKMKGGK
ncbi:MAG: helix-turn-helix domain-containing protein [bacterium]